MWLAARGELPEPLRRLAGYRPTVPEYGKLKTEVPEACDARQLGHAILGDHPWRTTDQSIAPVSTSTTPSSTTTAYAFTYPMGISITPSTISRMSSLWRSVGGVALSQAVGVFRPAIQRSAPAG